MKKIILLTITLLFVFGVLEINAQNSSENDTIVNEFEDQKVYDVADKMPQFPGGTAALFEYLSKNTRFEKDDFDALLGRVVVTFIVECDGSITNAKVTESSNDTEVDEAALRIVKSMPKWIPAEIDDEPVRVTRRLPITFKYKE